MDIWVASSERHAAGRGARERGLTLVEVVIAVAILLVASLALACAFTSSGLASRVSSHATAVHTSMQGVAEDLGNVPYDQILSWNGTAIDRGDHTVVVAANFVRIGLILVELTATDDRSQAVVGRLATYRAEGT